ncbi:MAG TPA: DMT family transporter [Steroidobacteraceae bacterium]|jgi:O-acetylserine/cysteine efflux transporter
MSRPVPLASAQAAAVPQSSPIIARDLALLLGINLIWGVNLIVSKIGLAEFPSILFTLLRFSILAVCLVPWLHLRRGQMGTLVVAAVFIGALQFALYFWGLAMATNVAAVAIANQLSVPFSTLLSVALLGEIVHWRRWTGIALSFGGVLIMGFDRDIASQWQSLSLVIGGAFIGCIGLIAIKKLHDFTPLELQAWIAWLSLPVLLVLSLEFERPDLGALAHVSLGAWGALLYTAIAASLVAHTTYFYLVQRYPVTSVAPVTTLSPLFSVLLCVLFLGETLSARLIVGGVCTLAGVAIITLREKRIVDTGT